MSFPSTVAEHAGPGPVGTPSGPSTVIDANTVVDGTLSTSQDLRIEGRVTGSVLCDGVIHVAEGAEVDANVEAAGIVVAGSLSGTIVCHGRLEIRTTGSVRGGCDHKHRSLKTALACLERDQSACASLPGGNAYSDRRIVHVDSDGRQHALTDDERDELHAIQDGAL